MADSGVRTEVDGRGLQLTNLDKQLFPDGTTKAELVEYYLHIAEVMLPHLADRCITRVRFPNGSAEASFYEKNAPAGTPDWVRIQRVLAADSTIDYVVADSPATLVWLANLAAIELHTPQWRVPDAPEDHRDRIVLEGDGAVLASTVVVDLDPGPGITTEQIATAAMLAAQELASHGLVPLAKTSGSKGMQVMARIESTPWREVLEQMRRFGLALAKASPDLFVTVMRKDQRDQRIFLDHLQNRADRNTVSVYSVRGREQPRVSTPLTWDEVAEISDGAPAQFTIDQVLERVERHGDLWADLLDDHAPPPLPTW